MGTRGRSDPYTVLEEDRLSGLMTVCFLCQRKRKACTLRHETRAAPTLTVLRHLSSATPKTKKGGGNNFLSKLEETSRNRSFFSPEYLLSGR